ncbi:hypothetical protein MRB53_032691 [Persea americana]|uniref:Uncharacterized protein n=1 Tax=Persea americana TaxID=3435 RepID=A0ACC2KSG1_PERAE|nr:hypothetical protein MRB53_032691 [Persea americana]
MNILLTRTPDAEEIRSAVFALNKDSSPGPDGFSDGCRSRRWPPRDLARLSLLHRSSAFDFLHQRRCVAACRLSRRLPCSKSNPSSRLFSSSIDGSISEWDLFSLKQKRVELKLEESQKGEVSSHEIC